MNKYKFLAASMAAWILLIGMLIVPTKVRAQSYRVGIFHPQPLLCQQQPHTQRDLRILRLVYGLEASGWNRSPWFYQQQKNNQRVGLQLQPKALWGSEQNDWNEWRELLLQRLPQASISSELNKSEVVWLPSQPLEAMLTISRLQGSELLPFPDIKPQVQLASNAEAVSRCRWWPLGVRMEHAPHRVKGQQEQEIWWYRLFFPRTSGEIELRGYRRLRDMWRDYVNGRLQAILVEGEDVASLLEIGAERELWGQASGGQQWVLRPSEKEQKISFSTREALVLATPRKETASISNTKQFVPATHFLRPLLTTQEHQLLPPLAEDSQRARIQWFEEGTSRPSLLRIAVVAHPWMENTARHIAHSWRRTLKLRVVVLTASVNSFNNIIPRTDFFLDVLDLNDGSLQDLWAQHLTTSVNDLNAWEKKLRAEFPYIPLLESTHYAFCKPSQGTSCLRNICPSCRLVRIRP